MSLPQWYILWIGFINKIVLNTSQGTLIKTVHLLESNNNFIILKPIGGWSTLYSILALAGMSMAGMSEDKRATNVNDDNLTNLTTHTLC